MIEAGSSGLLSGSAVILCGGLGSRLGSLTRSVPKPLLAVAGRPFIWYLLSELKRFGFRRVVLLSAFQSRQFVDFACATSAELGLEVSVSCEPEPAGTGGALHHALDRLDPSFLLLNGDSWFDFNWLDLVARAAKQPSAAVTLAARRVDDATRFGSILVHDGWVTRFSSRPDQGGAGLINGGVYYVHRDLLATHLSARCSLEQDVLPKLSLRGRVGAEVYDAFFLDIGIPDAFIEAQTTIPARQRRPAIFLDCDVVLDAGLGNIGCLQNYGWRAGAIDAVKRFNDAGIYVFIVFEQPEFEQGRILIRSAEQRDGDMQAHLRRHGAHIDDFCVISTGLDRGTSSCHSEAGVQTAASKTISQVFQEWRLERERSVWLTDKQAGLAAAHASRIQGMLVSERGMTSDGVERVLHSSGATHFASAAAMAGHGPALIPPASIPDRRIFDAVHGSDR